MKRYWLFSFENCYPLGGFQDFMGSFDTIDECSVAHNKTGCLDGHIFDSEKQVIVHEFYVSSVPGVERSRENEDFRKVFSINYQF